MSKADIEKAKRLFMKIRRLNYEGRYKENKPYVRQLTDVILRLDDHEMREVAND